MGMRSMLNNLIIFMFFLQFKCCGVTNKADWYLVTNGTLPSSCCSVRTEQCDDGWSEVRPLKTEE